MYDTLMQILELARWAPSGDNTQPWRFEIVADDHLVVHGHDTRDHVLYDFHGHPSHIAHGALLETIRLAGTRFGLIARWTRRPEQDERFPVYDIHLTAEPDVTEDPLVAVIAVRTVQRRAMRLAPLKPEDKLALEEVLPAAWHIDWYPSTSQRFDLARLLFRNADIRLRTPEAYPVHKSVIEWGVKFSEDRIPEQAVGVDPMTARLMRWVMQSWPRVKFFNRYLFGTWIPRIQLDFLPAVFCSAHAILRAPRALVTVDDFVEAGGVIQRFWLTCARNDIQLQPAMTPLIFSWYVAAEERFTSDNACWEEARELAALLSKKLGPAHLPRAAFWARVGYSQPARSRSLRLPLKRLFKSP
ncbi:MAG: hypothetical protein JWN23_3131 [Rhodocyclales bacterium]|nr:hypothetical protein [Rhodocyclales bacterium]